MKNPMRSKKPPWMHIGALFIFVLVMLLDLKVTFQPATAHAKDIRAAYGSKFVAVRSDVWTCFRLRENIRFDFGFVSIPERCQESYMVVVQTESCLSNRSDTYECTVGTWRWVPNPPCGNSSTTGWYLPPC